LELSIDEAALAWFQEEVELESGDRVKFHPRYGGASPVQQGFSLAFSVSEAPDDPAVSVEKEGILFFIEAADVWYFDGHNLHVGYNEQLDEPEYHYRKS